MAIQDVELYREYFNNPVILTDPILHSLLDASLPRSLLILDDAKVVLPVPVSLAPLTVVGIRTAEARVLMSSLPHPYQHQENCERGTRLWLIGAVC